MNLQAIIIIARKHLGRDNYKSAKICLEDALRLKDEQEYYLSARCALRSIAYSIGILHPDYKKAWEASGFEGEPRLPTMSDVMITTA